MTATPMNVNATHNYVFPVTRNYIITECREAKMFVVYVFFYFFLFLSPLFIPIIYDHVLIVYMVHLLRCDKILCVLLTSKHNDQNETENGLLLVNFNA